ncbi:MAG: glycoside hydrolase family 16 protein [Rhodospirillaceae bacterium]|nr:glycoside hydrolase family 16 protein [Rhodospirillaceae bacterium]
MAALLPVLAAASCAHKAPTTPQAAAAPGAGAGPGVAPPPVVAPLPGVAGPLGQVGQWKLLFNDEFDGTGLDPRSWVTCYWWDRNGCTNLGNRELQWYRPANVSVSGGVLRLDARREGTKGEGGWYAYTSGIVTTGRTGTDLSRTPGFAFTYGFVEMRALVPAGRGLLPAFWMLPSSHASLPEIDVMEILGQEPHRLQVHLHYRDDTGRIRRPGKAIETADLSAGWHVYGLDWQPGRLVWYLDGVERWRYEQAAHVPHEPMYLLVNLAVGGNWPGPPDGTTRFPAALLVDYVRVWQRCG